MVRLQTERRSLDPHYVGSGSGVGDGVSGVSLALDRHGIPHVSYYNVTQRTVMFARKTGGSWLAETVDVSSGGDVTSIAMDDRGNPWVSYIFNSGGPSSELRVARRSVGTWVHETVDTSPTIGEPSLAIDAFGNPCVSYLGGGSDLKFAGKIDGGWMIAAVDTAGKVGLYSSLAIDANGDPWISYCDWTNMHLKFDERHDSWLLGYNSL